MGISNIAMIFSGVLFQNQNGPAEEKSGNWFSKAHSPDMHALESIKSDMVFEDLLKHCDRIFSNLAFLSPRLASNQDVIEGGTSPLSSASLGLSPSPIPPIAGEERRLATQTSPPALPLRKPKTLSNSPSQPDPDRKPDGDRASINSDYASAMEYSDDQVFSESEFMAPPLSTLKELDKTLPDTPERADSVLVSFLETDGTGAALESLSSPGHVLDTSISPVVQPPTSDEAN
ncbi:hypothetical protein HDU91_001491 [Kappamyces sp. JEL0680]|nr:hypothetical protein HDU91_001491 [Kappamyces sp. JEL0680]